MTAFFRKWSLHVYVKHGVRVFEKRMESCYVKNVFEYVYLLRLENKKSDLAVRSNVIFYACSELYVSYQKKKTGKPNTGLLLLWTFAFSVLTRTWTQFSYARDKNYDPILVLFFLVALRVRIRFLYCWINIHNSQRAILY